MIRLSRAFTSAALAAAVSFAAFAHAPAARADAASAVEEALAGDDEDATLDAIGEAAKSNDAAAVAAVVKALDSKSVVVCDGALDALGRMENPAALKALHSAYKSSSRIRDNDILLAALLKAIGRHGDPSSVDILADSPFEKLTVESGRARIMGLARIRTRESLDALRGMAVKASPSSRGVESSEFMGKFSEALRCAACVLSGQDFGTSRPDWGKWWRDEGRKMAVSPERPQVAADVRVYWERYWGEPYGGAAAAGPAKSATSGGAPFERVEKPLPAVVKDAVDEIDEAFRTGGPTERCLAIEKNAGIMDPDVVHQIARGLRDENRSVQLTAIEMLGWRKDKESLRQLHRMFNRERNLNKDDELYSELLKSIGRSGDPSSVDVLTENIFKGGLSYAAGRARILGMANIRTQDSVEEMFQAMRLGGGGRERRGSVDARPRFAEDMRLALAVATGEDLGTDKDAWLAWWQKNKKTFKISPKRPAIAPELRARWESYWGESY
jgi:HEAT repeat protein